MNQLSCTAMILIMSANGAMAMDPCLPGSWEIDGSQLAQIMGAQMGGTATYEGGAATLQITDGGEMSMTVEDLVIATQMPGAPVISVTLNGTSHGAMTTDGDTYRANAIDYNLIGTADVMGTRMEVPVTSAGGTGWGTSQGSYSCADDTLTFMPTDAGSIPPRWHRGP